MAVLWGSQGGSRLLSAIAAADSVPFARGRLLLEKSPSGARVMAWPEYGVVKVEGRLGAAVDGSSESHRLASRDELRQAGDVMAAQLRALLAVEPETRAAEVGRFDLVTERDFEDGTEGLSLLKAMRALCPPRCKLRIHAARDGRVETVAVLTERGGRTIFRAYDKGVESSTAAPGERIRFEAQVRRLKAHRQGPNGTANGNLRSAFGRTIEPFMEGTPVTVTSPSAVVDQVAEQLACGDVSAARAERLIGSAELLRRYGRGIYGEGWRSERRLRDLRRAGVAVDDELPEGARVPVSAMLSAALEAWSD